jgi:UDP-N-acetylglucosamine--N-acetylmuramyl-(pentapeptide) pyrophosphoryl-undecaprenol N-acetylglucosamine transferase
MKSASTASNSHRPLVAVACGGTGGHLFPGMAVAEELMLRGCDTVLLVSPKDVDQLIMKSAGGAEFATLPSIGMTRGRMVQFFAGSCKSYSAATRLFRERPPQAVLAMGGFTSAPPVLAGRSCGAVTFLHESNTIPGRANRWLAHVVDQAFVGFPEAVGRLHHPNVLWTGTPVRPQFQPTDPGPCRVALGLHPQRPLVLVTGGSQGASGVNNLVLQALPQLLHSAPDLQFIHLTGANDLDQVKAGYELHKCKALVRPFLSEMEMALGAATVAVSRAGASSMAELAAMRLPAVLIPYPVAADNHQVFNARAYAEAGAAFRLEQKGGTGEKLASMILSVILDEALREKMARALDRWHWPHAAELIAERMLALLQVRHPDRWKFSGTSLPFPTPREEPPMETNAQSHFQPGRQLA